MPHISVVAPVYNELGTTLAELVRRVGEAANRIGSDFEIILVDDGSDTETWCSIAELAQNIPQVTGIRFVRNFGQHSAISAGLDHSHGDWVVVMDSDLQDRPEVIPDLYAKAQEGYDVVFVNRLWRPESRPYRLLAAMFYTTLNFLAADSYNPMQGNFSIISNAVLVAFRRVPDRDRFYGGTIRWLGFPSTTIDADRGRRYAGQSSYYLVKRLRLARQFIIGYSTRLLYVALLLGGLMALVSLVMAIVIVGMTLSRTSPGVPGWPSVMTAVFFVGGITNLILGFIGLYIAELFNRSKGRPSYVISQTVGHAVHEQQSRESASADPFDRLTKGAIRPSGR